MTTVAQLIAKLQTLPQDAEVECGAEERGAYHSEMVFRPVDIEYMCISDYSSPEDMFKYPTLGGKVIVYIQGAD